MSADQVPRRRRRRNPRGEGSRLRQEILDAASEILERTGSADAVTLRAVARAVGIAAPSIYAHFADRDAIIDELVGEGFAAFTAELHAAIEPFSDPVDRLFSGCRAYMRFAAEHPRRYEVLFRHPEIHERAHEVDSAALEQGAAALNVLVEGIADCTRAGRSASQDPFADAVALWVAMHGLATLLAETPASFPWPREDQLLTTLVTRLARLEPARDR